MGEKKAKRVRGSLCGWAHKINFKDDNDFVK